MHPEDADVRRPLRIHAERAPHFFAGMRADSIALGSNGCARSSSSRGVRLPTDVHFREDGGYDTIPLPSLLVAFKEHDAIVACFDEESQYMLEGSAEPTVGVVFSPRKPEEVRRAMRVVARFVALNCELFQLVEELQEWEKRHAGTDLDRGEPSLRAA